MESKFDLSHPSGIAGIYFLGLSLGCFSAYLTFTIMGKTTSEAWVAVVDLTAALVFSIVGSIMLILGFLSLYLNVKRTKEGAGEEENANKVVLLLTGITIIFMSILFIVGASF